jgi:hypothetical protein
MESPLLSTLEHRCLKARSPKLFPTIFEAQTITDGKEQVHLQIERVPCFEFLNSFCALASSLAP